MKTALTRDTAPRRLVSMLASSILLLPASPSLALAAERFVPAADARSGEDEPDATAPRITGKIEGGGELRWLYGIPISAFAGRVMLGTKAVRSRSWSPSVFADVLLGRTEAGLGANHVVIGARIERQSRYFYGGLSFGAGYFWLTRVNGDVLGNPDGMLDLFFGPQVPLSDHVAVSLEGRVTAEVLPGTDTTVAYGPGLALGLRFF